MPLKLDPTDPFGEMIEIPSDTEDDIDENTRQLVTQVEATALVTEQKKRESQIISRPSATDGFTDLAAISADYETGNWKDMAVRLYAHRDQLKTIGSQVALYAKEYGWGQAAALSAAAAGGAVAGPVGAVVGFTSVEVGNAFRAIFGTVPKPHFEVGEWCAIDHETLQEKGKGMDVHLGFFLDEGLKVNHIKVFNLVLARPQEVLQKSVHALPKAQADELETSFGKVRDQFLEEMNEPLAIKAAGTNVDPGTELLVRGKGLDQYPVTVLSVDGEGVHVDDGGVVKLYQVGDLMNGDVEHNVTNVYGEVSGYTPEGSIGRHVGQYVWCMARGYMTGSPWYATEELAIIRQIFGDNIQVVYCFDGEVGAKPINAPWGRLADDELEVTETREFHQFTNAVISRDGTFYEHVPGKMSHDNALFCVGKATEESHAKVSAYFEQQRATAREGVVEGEAPNTEDAERLDFAEEMQVTGQTKGEVAWDKDYPRLSVAKVDTNMVIILGLAAAAVYLLATNK